jgi:hypothetical protein
VRPLLARARLAVGVLREVVAHHRGGGERLLEIGVAELAAPVDRVHPHAGEAVGLQLEAPGAVVRPGGVLPVGGRLLTGDAEQRLDVMAHLVRHDVRLGDVAEMHADPVRQRREEHRVEVDAEGRRAVERADIGRLRPAGGMDRLGEDRQPGRVVGEAGFGELLVPERFDVVEHRPQEHAAAGPLQGRRGAARLRRLRETLELRAVDRRGRCRGGGGGGGRRGGGRRGCVSRATR